MRGHRWTGRGGVLGRGAAVAALLALLPLASVASVAAAPGKGELAQGEVDPAPLGRVFARYVHADGVDYAGLKADEEARGGLTQFLNAAASMPEDAPLASWLNAYNMLVIEGVLARYPIDSVMSVPDFFKERRRKIAGRKRSLDEIEHEVVRPRFRDARVHMALNCGAVSCPPLAQQPFREPGLDAKLDALARAATGNPRIVRLKDGVLYHSKLFEWFREDFVRDAGSVRAWIARYATDPRLRGLPEGTPLRAMEYDWTLNRHK